MANDELLRHGLMHVVSQIDAVRLVGDLRYESELVDRLRALRPGLLILGVDRALALSHLLAQLDPTPKVVVVMDYEGALGGADLLRSGADALVDRRSPSPELLNVFRRVIAGQRALDGCSAAMLINELRRPAVDKEADSASQLTRREREVLDLLTEGLDNRTIATRLFVSEATVKFHLHNIMMKFGVHKRAALISTALGGRPQRGF